METAMLTIRAAQMKALETRLGAQLFENGMVAHLREQHSLRFGGNSAAELRALVRRAVSQAQTCGIDSFPGCAMFLELAVEFGENFPQGFAWAERSLSATATQSGDRRAEALLQAATCRLNEAEARLAAQMDQEEARVDAEELDESDDDAAVEEEPS
jgi:uncharacterized protein YlxW (UPF0749 family)